MIWKGEETLWHLLLNVWSLCASIDGGDPRDFLCWVVLDGAFGVGQAAGLLWMGWASYGRVAVMISRFSIGIPANHLRFTLIT